MTESDFMEGAWLSFISWAWGSADMRAEFTAATGTAIPGQRSGMEAAVDRACGFDYVAHTKEVLHRFVEWATRTHWGIESAPKAYRDSLKPRRKTRSRKTA